MAETTLVRQEEIPKTHTPSLADAGGLRHLSPVFDLVSTTFKVIGPLSLITALMFYYGWTRTKALYLAFGVDPSLLGFNNTDYLLRSIATSFNLLRIFLIFALIGLVVHFLLHALFHRLAASPRRAPRFIIPGILLVAGILSLLASVYNIITRFINYRLLLDIWYPACFSIGILLFLYSLYITRQWLYPDPAADLKSRRRRAARPAQEENNASDFDAFYRIAMVLGASLLILGVFWFTGNYASQDGNDLAGWIKGHLDTYPEVTVYSQRALGITGGGIEEARVSEDPDAFQWRYTGLRFLVFSGEKFFLLPGKSTANRIYTIIIPDDKTVRVEVSAGADYP